ncbi:hypothetical protein U91I_01359 [alpha proteobacterium U9-1i]|nr:hypothetical protein U91I_01359 [alpha proteobacterium U9-1i]
MRVLILALALTACAPASAPTETSSCSADEAERVVASMYFGRNIGGTLGVDDAEWAAFLDTEVTPRFPDGLTVSDADGQWRDSTSGAIVREPSKVLTLFLGDEAADREKLELIAHAYKEQFQQQAVALVVERSCVTFE